MTYRIKGLDPAPYRPLFEADDTVLAAALARRVIANSNPGFPCRASLCDAAVGEEVLLVHHVSNDVGLPFRMAHAIYVRKDAERAAPIHDRLPAMIDRRTIGLRAFDADGMMFAARLALPGEGDVTVRALLEDSKTAYVHAHNAAYGCFLAAIERYGCA
ncbi:MAG: DUF1203 domain-containing protein [Sphingomicrobium sp.]